jgi:phosphoribosylformylglycinamidine synthase
MVEVRALWEATSFALEARQCARECVASELALSTSRHAPAYAMSAGCAPEATPMALLARAPAAKARVAVIRCEGCNGDREMTAALYAAGCAVWDVHISDLAAGRGPGLEAFRGAIFPGGFSFADVLDSAKGWAGVIRLNPRLAAAFSAFYARRDTFSLGVCNGAQLLALLGWVPYCGEGGEGGGSGEGAIATPAQPRFTHNASGRFESRWSTVRVAPSPAVLLAGMEGSVLGVWVSHGEGRAHFPSAAVLARARAGRQLPLLYTDDAGAATEAYPMNPNGSPGGIAAMCSADGRHLAMMPHPERCVRSWQWPWMPAAWRESMGIEAPWHTMFVNARKFLEGE